MRSVLASVLGSGILALCSYSAAQQSGTNRVADGSPVPAVVDTAVKQTDAVERAALAAKFEREGMLKAYEGSTFRDPKWDDSAKALLEAFATACSSGLCGPSDKELRTEAVRLMSVGCKDPMIRAVESQTRDRQNGHWSWAVMRGLLPELERAGYPAVRRWRYAAAIANYELTRDRKGSSDYVRLSDQQTIEASMRAAFESVSGDRALESYLIGKLMGDEPEGLTRNLAASVDTWNVQPYVRDFISGWWHVEEAWRLRGTGTSDTVDAASWRGFERELRSAAARLTRAYEANPDRPEAPGLMVRIAGADGDLSDVSMSEWFRRAVVAQFDYRPAYESRVWFLRPRWGGSIEQMIQFGLECAATKRFDTFVPGFLWEVMGDVAKEKMDYAGVFAEPGLREPLERVRDGYMATDPRAAQKAMAMVIGDALRRRDREMAVLVSQRIKPCAASEYAAEAGFWSEEFEVLDLYTPEMSNHLLQAEIAASEGDSRRVLEAIHEVNLRSRQEPYELVRHLPGHVAKFRFDAAFGTGRDVELDKGENQGAFFRAFYSSTSPYIVDGAVVAFSSPFAEYVARSPVGSRYELSAKIELSGNAQSLDAGVGFGVALDCEAEETPQGIYVRVFPGRKAWAITCGWERQNLKPIESLEDAFQLRVTRWDDFLLVRIDGIKVFEGEMPWCRTSKGTNRFSLAITDYRAEKSPARYNNLVIRKITDPPADLEQLIKQNRERQRPAVKKPRF